MATDDPTRLQYLGMAGLGLAHELASPLTTTALALELLCEGIRAGRLSPEQVADQLTGQLVRVRRMGALVTRFRRFATGQGGLVTPVALDELVDGALQWLRPAVSEITSVSVLRGPPLAGLATARVDQILVEQALSCLVLNAVDALGERGSAPGSVTVWAFGGPAAPEDGGSEIWPGIVVEDDGPGFPDLALGSPGVSTKGERGMGVGLSLARTLVESFGGTLELSNRPEGGARAVLRFGSAPAEVQPQ